MSLAHKYTWGDFLKAHPEAKKKELKRTSAEGKKAFEAAFKEFAKTYLKEKQDQIKKDSDRATKSKKELVQKLKAVDGKKWHLKSKSLNVKIGRFDSYLAKLETEKENLSKKSKSL